MVDEVITKQELIDAQKDAQSLDDFINGGDAQTVVTRLAKRYPTLANAIRQIYEKGGKFYPTLAAANADIANIRTDIYVVTGDNGAYYKATAGATSLTKSPYDPLNQAKADATAKANAAEANAKTYTDISSEKFINWDLASKNGFYKPNLPYVSGTLSPTGGVVTNTARSVSDFTAINPTSVLTVNVENAALLINVCLYDINKNFVSYTTQSNWGINTALTIPDNARYARFTVLNAGVGTFTVNLVSMLGQVSVDASVDATAKANAAESNAKKFTRDIAQVFDASEVSNNYALTLESAIALVPEGLRKRGLIVRYNGTEERQFINDKVANWNAVKLWLRPFNLLKEGRTDLFDPKMIYKGFTIPNILGSVSVVADVNRGVAIVPIHRFYNADSSLKKLLLTVGAETFTNTSSLFLNSIGENISSFATIVKGFDNTDIPEGAAYAVINLTSPAMIEKAEKYLQYPNGGAKALITKRGYADGFSSVKHGTSSLSVDYGINGAQLLSPYFKSDLSAVNNVHIAQVVKSATIQKGQKSLINKLTGQLRRFYVNFVFRRETTASIGINYETEDGILNSLPQRSFPIVDNMVSADFVTSMLNDTKDFVRVFLLIDVSSLVLNQGYTFGENGEIHPSIVEKADRVANVNKGLVITEFVDYGTSRTVGNMQLTAPEPVALKRELINGYPINTITGDASKKHQQTVLMGSKTSRFYGKANVYADVTANYPNNPRISVLREPSSVDSNPSGTAAKSDLIGRNDSQYIHPDICYSPEGVAGYKYWMINSNFPNGYDPSEDADLFVCNDGVSWKRVSGFYESGNNGIAFKNPEVFWDTPNKNAFLPCPVKGVSLEFAKTGDIVETSTVNAFLNHDPAIAYHNGYIYVYILLGVGFNNASEKDYFYIICLRTNNGTDWEIVREDGSTAPYNQANALKIFSKTNGVRNHLRMLYGAGGTAGEKGFTPQIVKVSDNEWYYYDATKDTLTPSSGYSMNLLRYRGTSPYNFDFSNPTVLSKNDRTGGNLWHFCMRYYDGIFYCVTNGYMFTSTDGINFTTNPYQFFWQGISADLYKPSFVKGHDGKIKFAYSTQTKYAVPHPYAPQLSQLYSYSNMHVGNAVMSTLLCEYTSLADIINRSTAPVADAYADVLVMCISQRTRTTQVRVFYGIRELRELTESLDVSYDDEIYVLAHLNTRNGGSLEFKGVAVTLPNVRTLS